MKMVIFGLVLLFLNTLGICVNIYIEDWHWLPVNILGAAASLAIIHMNAKRVKREAEAEQIKFKHWSQP